mmetsp:Transcript_6665/g.29341  ORF Transcript_6665/g.29341 Transcript_6665/m.29341 type:complete len:207 (-) Transcript_6665:453-1073(-)
MRPQRGARVFRRLPPFVPLVHRPAHALRSLVAVGALPECAVVVLRDVLVPFRAQTADALLARVVRVVASCVVVVEHLETRRRLLRERLPSLRGGLRVRQKSSARGFLPTALACLACLLPPERLVRVLRGAAAGRVGFSEAAPEVFRRVGSDVGAAVVHVVGRQTHEPVLADPESGHVQSLVQRLASVVEEVHLPVVHRQQNLRPLP